LGSRQRKGRIMIREPDSNAEHVKHDVPLICPQCQNGVLEFDLNETRVQVKCRWCGGIFVFPSLADWNALNSSERLTQ